MARIIMVYYSIIIRVGNKNWSLYQKNWIYWKIESNEDLEGVVGIPARICQIHSCKIIKF